MKRCSIFCVLAIFAVTAFAAGKPGVKERIRADFAAETKALGRGYHYSKAIAAYRTIRARPQYATNAAARVYIAGEIVKLCKVPFWTGLKTWDASLQAEIPVEAKAILADPEVGFADKVPFAAALCCWQAGEARDFAAAHGTLDALRAAYPNAKPAEIAELDLACADLARWEDRLDDAWTALERASAGGSRAVGAKASALAAATGDWRRAHDIWARTKGLGTCAEILSYADKPQKWSRATRPPDYLVYAEAFVRDTGRNPLERARVVAAHFCSEQTPLQRELRALVKDADLKKVDGSMSVFRAYQQYGNHSLVLELEDYFGFDFGEKAPADLCRRHLLSLAAVGRCDEALAFARTKAAEPGVKPINAVKYRITEAILTDGDMASVIAAANLKGVEQANLWRTAARQALQIGKTAQTERYAARYTESFASLPGRRQTVRYFKKPVSSIADWRAIYGQLEPQRCDRKYGLSLEDMVTDVATGREEIKASNLDTDSARMELTTACDRYGLHVFLRVEDPNAPAIRDGFAGGIGGETYLAPGRGEPYLCLGVSAARGIEFAFQTQYDNANATRPDVAQRKGGGFRVERAFTETDYVVHIFYGWETYSSRIPVNGTVWRFGCNARSAKGAYTWGGSQGPHETSSWGDLVFELSPSDLTDIRKQLLCTAKRNWRKPGLVDTFDRWAASGRADPQFYAEVLAPLEKELSGLMDGVKADMTDEDVNRIFEAGYVRVRGLKHEIDRLRQNYLKRKLTEPDAE